MIKKLITITGVLLLNNALIAQSVEVLSTYNIPANFEIKNKTFGGISGIDYDSKKNKYYLISDDRSDIDYARMYTGEILITNAKIQSISIENTIYLKNSSGKFYDKDAVDFETVRLIRPNNFIIGDEGGTKGYAGIRIYDNNGNIIKSNILDKTFTNQTIYNKSFESISYYNKNNFVFATEAPLKSDNNESDSHKKSFIRVIAQNLKSNKKLWQAQYMLKDIKSNNFDTNADIGLSEILMYDKKHFFTLERFGYKTGEKQYVFDCRLYWATLKKNKDKNNAFRYITEKKEILNFSAFDDGKKNFEGLSYGPSIKGKKTLIVVSDNNFTNDSTTFFLLKFEY